MAFINQDLPGSYMEIDTSALSYSTTEFGTTDSVCIIGTAFNGPVGQPIQIQNPAYCEYVFGSVYDPITKKEASLTAGVLDAWNRKCRTIYAVRVSGKDVEKTFKLAKGNYKLKLSSKFPSNKIKDVSVVIDTLGGNYRMSLYKPATLATIREKSTGISNDNEILESTVELTNLYNLNGNSSLTEAINLFNNSAENNVVKFSIIDEKGTDITVSNHAKSITLDSILPGLYMVGRDKTLGIATTQIEFENVGNDSKIKVILNSDIQSQYPIYASNVSTVSNVELLNSKLPVSAKQATMYDFVKTLGKIDNAFGKDEKDYEEVDLTPFEIYEKLGGGFSQTMKIIAKDESNLSKGYRKIPAPKEDGNSIHPYTDGILPSIQNLDCKYRVIAGVYVDSKMNSKKVKLVDFKTLVSKSVSLARVSDKITVESIIDKDGDKLPLEYQPRIIFDPDFEPQNWSNFSTQAIELINTFKATEYETKLKDTDKSIFFLKEESNGDMILMRKASTGYVEIKDPAVHPEYNEKIFLVKVDKLPAQKLDELVLYKITNDGGTYKALALKENINEVSVPFVTKDAFGAFSSYNQLVNIYKINSSSPSEGFKNIDSIELIGLYDDVFSEEEEDLVVGLEQSIGKASSTLLIRHKGLDYTSFDNFVKELNNHPILGSYFKFAVNDVDVINKDVFDYLVQEETKFYSNNVIDLSTSPIDGTTDPLKFTMTLTYTDTNTSLPLVDVVNLIKNYDGSTNTQDIQALFDDVSTQISAAFTANSLSMADFMTMKLEKDADDPANKGTIKVFFKENNDTDLAISNNSGEGKHTDGLKLLGFESEELALTASDYSVYIPEFTDRMETYDTNRYIPYKTTDNFARLLAQHCAYTSIKNKITHGIIGIDRMLDVRLDSIAKKVNELMDMNLDLFAKTAVGDNMLDAERKPFHIGRYISIPIIQTIFESGNNYSYISTGAPGYAGLVSALDIDVAPTRQIMNVSSSPMYSFSATQIADLTKKGFVTTQRDSKGNQVIVDGVTMDLPSGKFKRFFTTKSIAGVEEAIKNATEPFIGKANNDATRNSLRTAVTSAMKSIHGILINYYDFDIDFTSQAHMGEVTIRYTIVPAFEIKKISNAVKVAASL